MKILLVDIHEWGLVPDNYNQAIDNLKEDLFDFLPGVEYDIDVVEGMGVNLIDDDYICHSLSIWANIDKDQYAMLAISNSEYLNSLPYDSLVCYGSRGWVFG